MSNSKFKGKLENYGYNKHGRGAYNEAVLRHNHLLKDPKVVVTIHFRETCRCSAKEISTKNYDPNCEKHFKKSNKKIAKNQKTIEFFFKKKNTES